MGKFSKKIELKSTEDAISQIKNAIEDEEELEEIFESKSIDWGEVKTISTGSSLLDLAISGGRKKEGGIPGGVIVELSGPAGSGKTAILAALAANAQKNGGNVMFLDPEARFDRQYSEIYGFHLEGQDYHRPNTVEEMFEKIYTWNPENKDNINVIVIDSLAALSTKMEMEETDKFGMRRAKCFSEGFRKTARIIADKNWIVACSNQQRDGQFGPSTPGGLAIKYYCSLRISIKQTKKISKEKDFHGKKIKKELGIESQCTIIKSSLDDPFRKCEVSILFRKGLDKVRDELSFCKTAINENSYNCFGKSYVSLDKAIEYIYQNNLEKELEEKTIEIWNEIENLFR